MGLFKKKETPAPEPAAPATPKIHDEFDKVRVNLSDKMLRVELTGDDGFVKYGSVDLKDDRILIVSSGRILIAEVTKRSKAFAELEPFAGRGAEDISIEAKTGDYGPYYLVRMKFRHTVID